MCGATADNAGVDLRLRPLWVRARLETAGRRSSLRLFLSQRRPACACAWLSVLYSTTGEKKTMACATRRLTVPTSALPAEAPPSSIPYMYVSRRTPAWNELYVCCMHQYAACSCPASTTSATGSNSRVLTHRLTLCSRSELLHRGKYYLGLPETKI